jgi:hypothetical protein
MYAIHLARAVIHQCGLLRVLCARDEKFPATSRE